LSVDKSVLTAPLHPNMLSRIKPRLDQILPIGNEGAGGVVAAGDSGQAQALTGKTVGRVTPRIAACLCKLALCIMTPDTSCSGIRLGVMLNKACIFYGR
jgi:hypothetical protein